MRKKTLHLWGTEETIINNDLYCMKKFYLMKGYQSSLHYHNFKDETFFIDSGIVEIEHNNIIYKLSNGDLIRIKPKEIHRFKALSDTAYMTEISTYDNEEDNVKIKQAKETK